VTRSARCAREFFAFRQFGRKVDIIILAAAWRGSRVVNHTSYTFTAAGTQRRLARVQLDLRRVRVRETFVCPLFLCASESIFPSPRSRFAHGEGISRVQTRIYYVMHTAAASFETPAIITCMYSGYVFFFSRI